MDQKNPNNTNNSDDLSRQYHEILAKYAANLNPPPQTQDVSSTPLTPTPIDEKPQEVESLPPPTDILLPPPTLTESENLDMTPPPPPVITPDPVTKNFENPTPFVSTPTINNTYSAEPQFEELQPKKSFNFFKALFFFSLFGFVFVAIAIVYSFLSQPQDKSPVVLDITPTPNLLGPTVPPSKTGICQLNGQEYQPNQTFTAYDGCNTCKCESDLTISCTQKVCPSAKPTTKSSVTTIDTSSWVTYDNKEFGYSFKYPKDWKNTTDTATVANGNKEFRIETSKGEFVSGTVLDGVVPSPKTDSIKYITLSGKKYLIISYFDNLGPGSKPGVKDLPTFNQVVESIKIK